MRILHFNSNISQTSGVMSIIMNYYREMIDEAVHFDFLYFRESATAYDEEIKNLGGRCYKLSSPKNVLHFEVELKKFVNEHVGEYDIVHIHDSIFAKLLYPTFKRVGVKSVIVHSHATQYSDKKLSNIRNRILCHNITKYADTFFACSEEAGKFLFKSKPFYVMNNAIKTSKYEYSQEKRNELREKFDLNDSFIVGHVGAFVNQKNHDFLLDVFKEIKQIKQNSKLMLVGDGPLLNSVKEKSRLLGLDSDIMFLGKRTDVNELYQAMDIFVLPSFFEGLPMVGVEAQCSGLPAVFSKTITKEVEINKCLFLNLSVDKKQWARCIIGLFQKSERSRIDALCRVKMCGFDISEESKKLIHRYTVLSKG